LSPCTLPGEAPSSRLAADEYELGLGIHGEPGHERLKVEAAERITEQMLTKMLQSSDAPAYKAGDTAALMVNNLGATPIIEMYWMAKLAIDYLAHHHNVKVIRCVIGHFMTSLDMKGISFTLLRLDDDVVKRDLTLTCLDADTTAPAWPRDCHVRVQESEAVVDPFPNVDEKGKSEVKVSDLGETERRIGAALKDICEGLLEYRATLNELDQTVGDGDTGDTFARGANEILQRLNRTLTHNSGDGPSLDLCAGRVLSGVADCLGFAMGGSSGAVLEIFFRSAGTHLSTITTPITPSDWLDAFHKGATAVQFYGGASPGMRTLLDSLLPALSTASTHTSQPLHEMISAAADAAEGGAEATKKMIGRAGRSSYVPSELLQNHADPGAVAVAFVVRRLAVFVAGL